MFSSSNFQIYKIIDIGKINQCFEEGYLSLYVLLDNPFNIPQYTIYYFKINIYKIFLLISLN